MNHMNLNLISCNCTNHNQEKVLANSTSQHLLKRSSLVVVKVKPAVSCEKVMKSVLLLKEDRGKGMMNEHSCMQYQLIVFNLGQSGFRFKISAPLNGLENGIPVWRWPTPCC